jgi:hypothetical protein
MSGRCRRTCDCQKDVAHNKASPGIDIDPTTHCIQRTDGSTQRVTDADAAAMRAAGAHFVDAGPTS